MSALFIANDHEIEIFSSCFKNQLPLMIKGPTGCGKSQLVEHMAEVLERPLIKVACNEDTNAADLLGRYIIKGGETIWQDGPVTRAVREGCLLYLDEIAEAREDVVVAIHPLTDHRREVYLDKLNETVKAKDHFMLIASFNPGYQKGLKELKPSTRQRFVNISMSYLPLDKEIVLLQEFTGVSKDIAKKLCVLAGKVRQMGQYNLKETLSSRLLVSASQLIVSGMNPRLACHVCLAETLSDDLEIVQALKDLIDLSL